MEALLRIVSQVSVPACKTKSYVQTNTKSLDALVDSASVKLENFLRNSHIELTKEILSVQSDMAVSETSLDNAIARREALKKLSESLFPPLPPMSLIFFMKIHIRLQN